MSTANPSSCRSRLVLCKRPNRGAPDSILIRQTNPKHQRIHQDKIDWLKTKYFFNPLEMSLFLIAITTVKIQHKVAQGNNPLGVVIIIASEENRW